MSILENYRLPNTSKYFLNIGMLVNFLNILLEYRYTCYHIFNILLEYRYNCCHIFFYFLNISILLTVFVVHLYKYHHTFICLLLHTSYVLKIFTFLLLYFLHTCMNISNLLTFIFTYFSFRNILEYAHILACNYSVNCSPLF